jgi:hypothetical protein
MQYNGWTNKETWLVNLWLGDSLVTDAGSSMEIDAAWVKEVADMLLDGAVSDFGLASDLLEMALASVNWEEIAAHYKND